MNGPALPILIAVFLLLLCLIVAWVKRVSVVAWRADRRSAKAERIAKGAVVLADVLEQTMPQIRGGGPRHATDPPDATVHQLRRDVARHPVRAAMAAAVLAALCVAAPLALSERATDAAPPFEPIPPRPTTPDNSSPPATTTVTVTVTEPGVVGQVGPAGPKGDQGEPGVELVRDGAVPTGPASSSISAAPRSEPLPPLSSSSAPPSEELLGNPRTCPTPPVPPPPTECRGQPAARTVGEG